MGSVGVMGCSGCTGQAQAYYPPAPGVAPTPNGVQPPPAEPQGDEPEMTRRDTRVTLQVTLPSEARVYVNERLTRSDGPRRRFQTSGLVPGQEYVYTVRAERTVEGRKLTETKAVTVVPGQTVQLAFALDGAEEVPATPVSAEAEQGQSDQDRTASRTVRQVAKRDSQPASTAPTTLELHVPAGAKVFLAGRTTRSRGRIRHFSTTRLTGERQWADYPIRVEVERDGRTLTHEQTITLTAGQTRRVAVKLDGPRLASRDLD